MMNDPYRQPTVQNIYVNVEQPHTLVPPKRKHGILFWTFIVLTAPISLPVWLLWAMFKPRPYKGRRAPWGMIIKRMFR